MKASILSFMFFMAALLASHHSFGQQAREIVATQISYINRVFNSKGFYRTHNIKYASLYDDQSDFYTFNLDRATDYEIFAVCDGDCGDIDLWLYDESGNLIDSDQKKDDLPVVVVTPSWTGKFRLKVKMYDCRIEPCVFGIGVYGR